MGNFPPKNERNLLYGLQGITICISLISVIATFFSASMSYNAISLAQVSAKLSKDNEIESRLYNQKYEFYKGLTNNLQGAMDYELVSSGSITGYEGLASTTDHLLEILKKTGPEMRLLGGDNVLSIHNYIYQKALDYSLELLVIYGHTEVKDTREPGVKIKALFDGFAKNIVGGIWLLENAMRLDLGKSSLPPVYISNQTFFNPEGTGGWIAQPDCRLTSEINKYLDYGFYIK